jgi:ribose transport system substrate-binding protein
MLTGFPGGTADRLRTAGALAALKNFPKAQLLAQAPGKWNRIDGRTAFENMATRFPNYDAVLALNDDMAVGALSAIKDAGRKGVPIVGHNGTFQIMQLIQSGDVLASAATFPFWQGAYAVVRAYDAYRGYKLSPPETMMLSGHAVIDKSNVDTYVKKFLENIANLPLDYKKMSRVDHPQDWDPQNLVYPIVPDQYWSGISQPSGFQLPKAFADSISNGQLDQVKKDYEAHYKMKLLSA